MYFSRGAVSSPDQAYMLIRAFAKRIEEASHSLSVSGFSYQDLAYTLVSIPWKFAASGRKDP